MINKLHAEKVTILSRLVKENNITLEEALLLLKNEDDDENVIEEEVTKSINDMPFKYGGYNPVFDTMLPPNGTTSSNGIIYTLTGNSVNLSGTTTPTNN